MSSMSRQADDMVTHLYKEYAKHARPKSDKPLGKTPVSNAAAIASENHGAVLISSEDCGGKGACTNGRKNCPEIPK
jgi:hypothetical protein